jgi:hypothetical protein
MSTRVIPLLFACLVLAACSGTPAPPPPLGPMRGTPPTHPTGIRLVVPSVTPSVLTADTGVSAPIPGAPTGKLNVRQNWVIRVGNTAVIGSAPKCNAYGCLDPADVLVYDKSGPLRSLGKARSFAASADAQGLWMIRDDGNKQCHLELQPLSGAKPGPSSPAACSTVLIGENRAGLALRITTNGPSQTVVIDPATGRTIQQYSSLIAMTPDQLLVSEAENTLTLVDPRSEAKHPVSWPAQGSQPGNAVLSRDGRYLAVPFVDPSVDGTSHQSYDLWLLDLIDLSWVHPPSMPIEVDVANEALDWTAAGDVVIAGPETETGVGSWRPGQDAWTLTPGPLLPGWTATMVSI